MQLWRLITQNSKRRHINTECECAREQSDINELSCLYGIKPLMKVIHRDSYVNKAELVKFTQDHTR